MAALTPIASVEALVSAIEKSGLLSSDGLEKVREAAAKASDPKALARDLIKCGLLTRWQAEQLINGYHRLLVGNYKLLDQIRTSPTGRLYLAEHAQMGRRHLLKVLARRLASNAEAVKHFLDSARNACSLDHRNISHVYDVNQDRIGHYVVMEQVEGQTLEDLVERTGRVPVEQALEFVRQAAEGLAHAHANGVVHGDLKPVNLLRDHSGTIKILEIGQAEFGAKPEIEDADESVETASLAAVIFQAPELRGDGEAADVACDVYSIGSVFCFLLTAKAAKDAAAAVKLLEASLESSPETVAFCRKLMAENPQERPASMEKVLAELGALSQQLAVAAKAKADEKMLPDAASLKDAPRDEKWKKKGADAAQKEKDKKPTAGPVVEEVAAPAVLIPTPEAPAVQPPPAEPFVIKTRGRIGKSQRKASKGQEGDQAAEKKDEKEPRGPIYTPLVLAGAIGGGGVLVLGLGIAVICALTVLRGGAPLIEAPQTTAVVAVQDAPAATPAVTESNPEAPAVVDANPELVVEASADADVAVEKPPTAGPKAQTAAGGESKAAESSAPAAGSSASKAPMSELAVAEPKASPAPEKMVEAAPAAPEPKAQAPEPRPVAAKPAAKPQAADPFAGFAKAVSLPELPESPDAPSTTVHSPVALGPCTGDEKAKLTIGLLGGDTAVRAPKQRFELLSKGEGGREWNFVLTGGATPINIATLIAQNGRLMFQWTEDGVKQASVAKQLSNCALALGAKRQAAALRTAEQGAPLAVDIDKAGASVKWNIGDLPLAKQVFVEVTRAEGFKVYRQEPKGPVSAGDQVQVATGSSDKSAPPLFLKLSTSATANAVEIKMQTSIKLEGGGEARPYRRKDLLALQQQKGQELSQMTDELTTVKRSNPQRDPEKKVKEATIARMSNELLTLNTTLDQLRYVVDFSGVTDGQAKLHFRVYCLAGDAKVDLLRTEDEMPLENAK
jgi:serine/threonine protein kinase